MMDEKEIDFLVKKSTLLNALKYNGKPQVKSVLGSIMADCKELRPQAKEIKIKVEKEVERVEKLTIQVIKDELASMGVESEEKKSRGPEEKELPPLPGIKHVKKPTFRLAPYPSGPLHIGNARMVVLNDEYAKKTNGKLILCFDDTIGSTKKKREQEDSKAKYVLPEAYDMLRENLNWLGVKWHQEVFKSDRLDIYYEHCTNLIKEHYAYVCTCSTKDFKKLKDNKKPCPHRDQAIEENMGGWNKMQDGLFEEGEAVVRLKTGVDLPDPALREPVIMRISDATHPRVGTKYRVWPMLEFSWGIDDHLLEITHIIRGKDLFKEDFIEEFIWDLMGWDKPHILHYGMLRCEDGEKLSKTYAREQINKEIYSGWDDPRTWSLQSLEKRGIQPESLRKTLLSSGLSMTDIDFPYKVLYANNQKLIDPIANRYFFVENPVILKISDVPKDSYVSRPLINPLEPKLGEREINISIKDGTKEILISRKDFQKIKKSKKYNFIRLKDLMNVEIIIETSTAEAMAARYVSDDLEEAREKSYSIIHWVDCDVSNHCDVNIIMPDGAVLKGKAEKNFIEVKVGSIVQFERFGFVRVNDIDKKGITAYLTH
ncbi:MAG: glutamate--tRNA ligase [Candidatus Hodarchaeota archaeon]